MARRGQIIYKSAQELDLMRKSAELLAQAHGEVAAKVAPGVTTLELDKIAYEFIMDNNAVPSFLNYGGFPNSLCMSLNDMVVHGIPSNYVLKEGDIISIDCGVYLNEFHSDSAFTYPIGEVADDVMALLKATKESLYEGIAQVKAGKRIGDVSNAIQYYVEQRGYSVVRELIGHGVGRNLHESPDVPNYGKRGRGPALKNGMVIAIEPMVNLGKKNIFQEDDGWTIRTKDRKVSAHYEHTVAMVNNEAEILTSFKYIEKYFKI